MAADEGVVADRPCTFQDNLNQNVFVKTSPYNLHLITSIAFYFSHMERLRIGKYNISCIWNDIQGPLLWINSKKNYTITLALSMLSNISDAGTPVTMAGSVLSIIPIIILFIIFQKYFERSVISAGVKG